MSTNLDYKDEKWMLRKIHDAKVVKLEERIKALEEQIQRVNEITFMAIREGVADKYMNEINALTESRGEEDKEYE